MFSFIFSFFLVSFTSCLYANGISPEFFLYWGAFYSAITFTVGLLLEYICVCILAHAHTSQIYWRAALCTITMNLASTIVGVLFRAPFAILYLIFKSKISSISGDLYTTPHPVDSALSIIGIYLIYVMINTIIEALVAEYYFFPKIARKRVWLWVFIANCLSMGLITLMIFLGAFVKIGRYFAI